MNTCWGLLVGITAQKSEDYGTFDNRMVTHGIFSGVKTSMSGEMRQNVANNAEGVPTCPIPTRTLRLDSNGDDTTTCKHSLLHAIFPLLAFKSV